MHAVIFTGGVLRPGPAVTGALASADLILAADSGADTALEFQQFPQAVIGDLDSIKPKTLKTLRQQNCSFVVSPAEKDQSDTELAIQYAASQQATRITVLGGIEGDRIDHIFANILLTTDVPVPVVFASGATTAWVEIGPKPVTVPGVAGDLLSLIPLSPTVAHITTAGLRYPLHDEALAMGRARGISNVLDGTTAQVEFSGGLLLFVHTVTQPN